MVIRYILYVIIFSISGSAIAQYEGPDLPEQNDTVQVLVSPRDPTTPDASMDVVAAILQESGYSIEKEVSDDIFLTTISTTDLAELASSTDILVQKNQLRQLFTTTEVLSLVGADQAHALPASGKGSGYATVIIDTGVRSTHQFFTQTGSAYNSMTNPSRVTVEHCQSGGQYVLDSVGNKLYEGISLCSGNIFAPTVIDGFTYYSNTIPGTLTPSFGAAAPCLGEYPGFSSTGCRHGSHVAGIAAGTAAMYNSSSYSGIAPESSIIGFNVFTKYTDTGICSGASSCLSATDADILSALSQVEDLVVAGENIGSVNMSLGGGSYTDQSTCDADNILYYYAFQRLRSYGVPVIVATGNNAYTDRLAAPACVSSAYSVGSTTITSPGVDAIAPYSNIASFVDYLAPGTSMVSADVNSEDTFFTLSGTSMATPVVAGAFTVLRSLFDGTQSGYPYRSLDAIAGALSTTGLLLDDARSGGSVQDIPRINVMAAINSLTSKPYIALPNQSTVNISYPFSYSFSVSGAHPIDVNDIILGVGTTVNTDPIVCTQITASSYDCVVLINSEGDLVLSVSDSLGNTYTTPIQPFETLPVVASVSTTTVSGTYSTGTVIPITAHVTGVDSGVRAGSVATALLDNGVSVVLTASNSATNTLTGSYTVGSLGSGQDSSQLKVVNLSSITLTENDGTIYSGAVFDTASMGTNMDQSGKIIVIDTTAPVITAATLIWSGAGTNITPGSTILLNLTTNKTTSTNSITINGGSPGSVTQITSTEIQAQKTVTTGELGSVTFSATVTDQFGNVSPVITTTTDASTLTMIAAPVVSVSSGGGGGGGGGFATPAKLSEKDTELFCSATLAEDLTDGAWSIQVLYAETALQIAGYFGSLPNYGYNSGTVVAVRNFQARYTPSHITGSIDVQTWELLKLYGGCKNKSDKRNTLLLPATVNIPTEIPKGKEPKLGARSPIVVVVRNQLAQLGYIKPTKKPSSIFNVGVLRAIKKFQKQNKLPTTGKIDNATYRLLQTLATTPPARTTNSGIQ